MGSVHEPHFQGILGVRQENPLLTLLRRKELRVARLADH